MKPDLTMTPNSPSLPLPPFSPFYFIFLAYNTNCCTFDLIFTLSWWDYIWTLKNISALWSKGNGMAYHRVWGWDLKIFFFSRSSEVQTFLCYFLQFILTPKLNRRSFLFKRRTWEEFKSELVYLSKYLEK